MSLQTPQNKSIILVVDQSNSTGLAAGHVYSNLPSQYQAVIPNAYSIKSGGGLYNYLAGFNSIHGDTSGTSFEWTASCAYKLRNTYNKHPVIVNMSVGNTSLYSPAIGTNTWDYTVGGNLYTAGMNAYFYPTLARCLGTNDLVCVLGLCENDSTSSAAANAHYTNKKALITKLRSSVGSGGTGFTNLKIVLMKPKIELDPATHPYTQTVIDAIDQILGEDPLCYEFDEAPLSYQGDLIHWTDASTVTAGGLLADVIAPLIQF